MNTGIDEGQNILMLMAEDGNIVPLNNAFEIDGALRLLKELDRKVDFLKGLKKHRADQIDTEISAVNNQIDRLRMIILKTMQTHEPKQKTLQFPSVGKVTRRSVKESWEIKDKEALLEFFESKGRKNDVIKVKEELDTKAAKSLVESFVEDGITVPGTSKVEATEGLSVSFDDEDTATKAPKKEKARPEIHRPKVTKATEAITNLKDLDELEV